MKNLILKKVVAAVLVTVSFAAIATTYSFFNNTDKKIEFKPLDSFSENGPKITIKQNCYWDNPGSKPWKGDTVELLKSLGLNEHESATFIEKFKNNEYNSIVYISKNSIVEDTYPFRSFKMNMDMSSGTNILCKNTFPGKNWGYKKYKAKWFMIEDKHILVPEVCGNITRAYFDTFLLVKSEDKLILQGENFNRNAFSTLPYDLDNQGNKLKTTPSPDGGPPTCCSPKTTVPAPNTLLLMVSALFLLRTKLRSHPSYERS